METLPMNHSAVFMADSQASLEAELMETLLQVAIISVFSPDDSQASLEAELMETCVLGFGVALYAQPIPLRLHSKPN